MAVRVDMIGSAHVVVDGATRPLRPTIRDQALAHLACTGEGVTRDRLGFLFWADQPDVVVRHNVRQLLKRIRRLDWATDLEADDTWVRWPVETDLSVLGCGAATPAELPRFGELLPGIERGATLEFEEWLIGERARVADLWHSAAVEAARAAVGRGRPREGALLLEAALDREGGEAVLAAYVEAALAAGDRIGARAAIDRVTGRLAREGREPPAGVVDLLDRSSGSEDIGPTSAPEPTDGQRPADGVVGRSGDVEVVAGLLGRDGCRLLTLLGPGGIGKSTLAAVVVERMVGRGVERGAVVPLANLGGPSGFAAAVAAALGVVLDEREDPFRALSGAIGRRSLLLVLDDAEHLVAAGPQIAELVHSCPALTVVVTSRQRLGMPDEWVHEVGGLDPSAAGELLQRWAGRLAPGVVVDADDAAAVGESVGGSPLGIELAAPWLRVMAAVDIPVAVREGVGILRRDGLAGPGAADGVDSTMARSWSLATDEQRVAIEALTVFAAPFGREAAEEVAGATPGVLRDLVDRSLVRHRVDGRFDVHPLVRQYGADRLADDAPRRERIRDRHAAALLVRLADLGGRAPEAPELDDVVVAWRHAVERADLPLLAGAAEGLVELAEARCRLTEARELMVEARGMSGAARPGSARPAAALRVAESLVSFKLGRHREALRAAEAALALASSVDDGWLVARSHVAIGWASKWLDGDDAQYAATIQALAVARSIDDDELLAQVLNGLGCSAPTLSACRDHLLEGLDHAVDAPASVRALLLHNLGMVSWGLGDGSAAVACLTRSLQLARSAGWAPRVVSALVDLAFVEADGGDLSGARERMEEAERLLERSQTADLATEAQLVAGELALRAGDRPEAERRMLRALRGAEATGSRSLAVRALRLHAELLLVRGETATGLGMLAVVVANTGRSGGDFTSEILTPRIWRTATEGRTPEEVDAARSWAAGRQPEILTASVLAEAGERA